MSKTSISGLLLFALFLANACKSDDTATPTGPDYGIHILSPDNTDKHVGDVINIKVDFEDHNGGTVHHINLKIYNELDTANVIYNLPAEPHIHETSGFFEYNQMFVLDSSIVQPNSDWILKASVWGHDEGIALVTGSTGFHVLPQ